MPYKDPLDKKRWNERNPDKVRAHTARHDAKKRPARIASAAKRKADRERLVRYKAHLRLFYFLEMGGECSACGLVDNPIVFDYHHVEPGTKLANVGHLINVIQPHNTERVEELEAELAKCVLVCVGCHRKIHARMIPCPPVTFTPGKPRALPEAV